MQHARSLVLTAIAWAILCPGLLRAEANWTYWRGPQMNQAAAAAKSLPATWNAAGGEGSNVLWKAEIGSRSTPVFLNNRLYLITTDHLEEPEKAREKVVCLDGESGEVLWEKAFNVYLSDVPIERVGWSSVVADAESGNVFVLGVCGYFACLNGATGDVVWDKSLHEEYGLLSTYGGRTNFPIVHENNVIVNSVVIGWGGNNAKPAHRFIAFDKSNGQPVFFEGTRLFPFDTTYSAPVLAVVEGELQLIFGSGDGGVHAMQPRTGKILWSYFVSKHGINTPPLVVGNRVYCGHSEENLDDPNMGALFCIDATQRGDITKTGQVWRKTGVGVGRSAPIHIDGKLYVVEDTGKMKVFNAENGEELDELRLKDRAMRTTPLLADGKLYFGTFNGMTYVIEPKPEGGLSVLHEKRLARGEEVHGSAISVNGRIYFPTTSAMYCIGTAESTAGEDAAAEQGSQEPARESDMNPALVQVAPVESLLRPGFRQGFQVRLYNAKGQYLRIAKPEECQFSIEGPGEIDGQGRYAIREPLTQPTPVYVTVKHGEATGKARIRVVPDLDWSFNFDDGQIPITWVGCSYRHVPLNWDLITKLREKDPRAADLYIYIQSGFVNTGAPSTVFDDSTPRMAWSELLRFLRLLNSAEKPKTVAEGQERLGPALQLLIDEKVIASADWSEWDRPTGNGEETVKEPKLTVTKGDRPFDGNGVMCKITTIPLGTRSQGWMGHTDLNNYTIQADVLGYERDGQRADIAVTAQRYTLVMMGQANQLQIRTWFPQLNRFSVTVPFEWQKDTWYTMKFRASVEEGKAMLKGKVWKKGEQEPGEWTIQGTDELPNISGSPGFFGDAKTSEIFYDNVSVTRNTAE